MPVLKAGPLTQAELFDVWKGALDKSYREPMLEAGEGRGLEAHTQALNQLARVSTAIDVTTQAMFICPWSGQTNPPAAGAAKATVTLTFERRGLVDKPLVLGRGFIFTAEELLDMSPEGSVTVQTGRRYVLTQNLVFHPGDVGPFTVVAEAEAIGYGYNNPLPGTIRVISQPGNVFENDLASVVVTLGVIASGTTHQALIVTPNEPDTFVPEHVGQYMLFTAGSNIFKVARIMQFIGPDLTAIPPIGSTVEIEWVQSIQAAVFAGTFQAGERVQNAGPTVRANVAGERIVAGKKRLTFVETAGASFAVGDVLTGQISGATATIESLSFPQDFVSETATAAWRILDWVVDWQLTVTNVLSPTGGLLGWLDELGSERNLARGPGEDDETYRQRIKAIADVVTPNAIRRTLSKTLGSIDWCFREVGTENLRGWFYDGDRSPPHVLPGGAVNDAYDTDVVLFTGVLTSGTFVGEPAQPGAAEPVVLEDTVNNVKMRGFFGRVVAGVTFTFIRKQGSVPASLVGLRIRGLVSGAIFSSLTSAIVPASVNARRFRTYFDYTEFRGFFLVGVPRLGAGEFGFAYDAGPSNAYDVSPFLAFYDGFPVQAALLYKRVHQAISEVKAGGVGFDLYLEEIGCP